MADLALDHRGPRPRAGARLRAVLLAGLAAVLGGCQVATPWRQTAEPTPATSELIVVVTAAALDGADREASARFWDGVWRVERSLGRQPGLVGYSLRRELLGDRAWTLTAWESEQALTLFMLSAEHGEAMRTGRGALRQVRTLRYTLPRDAAPPRWDDALARLATAG